MGTEDGVVRMMDVECMFCGLIFKRVPAPPLTPDLRDDMASSGICLDCCGYCGKKKPVEVVYCSTCAAILGQRNRTAEEIQDKEPKGESA